MTNKIYTSRRPLTVSHFNRCTLGFVPECNKKKKTYKIHSVPTISISFINSYRRYRNFNLCSQYWNYFHIFTKIKICPFFRKFMFIGQNSEIFRLQKVRSRRIKSKFPFLLLDSKPTNSIYSLNCTSFYKKRDPCVELTNREDYLFPDHLKLTKDVETSLWH